MNITSRGKTPQQMLDLYATPVPECGCLLWCGGGTDNGYGVISWKGEHWLFHRWVWTQFRGPIPSGLLVCHTCDVRSCGNIDHLFLGTHADNSQDMIKKGRSKPFVGVGVKNPRAVLTEDDVRHIRQSHETTIVLGAKYGVTPGMIGHIRHRRSWKHVA